MQALISFFLISINFFYFALLCDNSGYVQERVTVQIPLFREFFLRRMRQNPEGSKRETSFYAVAVHREAYYCEQRGQ